MTLVRLPLKKIVVKNSQAMTSILTMPDDSLVGIGTDFAFYSKATMSAPWMHVFNCIANQTMKVTSFVRLGNGSFLGYSPHNGQFRVLGNLKSSWYGDWSINPKPLGLGSSCDGGLISATDSGVYTGTTHSGAWVQASSNPGLRFATQLSGGSIVGVGKDNLVYAWDSNAGTFGLAQECGTLPVIALAELGGNLIGLGTDGLLYYAPLTQEMMAPPPAVSLASKVRIVSETLAETLDSISVSATYEVQFSGTEVKLDVGFVPTLDIQVPQDLAAQLQVTPRRVTRTLDTVYPGGQKVRQFSFTTLVPKDALIHPLHSARVFDSVGTTLWTHLNLTVDIQGGDVSLTQGVTLWTAPPPSALEFNGVDTYLEVNSPLPITTQLTVEMWMRGVPKEAFLFFLTDEAHRRQFSAHVPYADGNVYCDSAADAGNNYDRIVKAVSPADDKATWNHWAFVRDSVAGRMAIYRNGALWLEQLGCTRTMTACNRLVLAADGDGLWFHAGALCEVRVWSVARTAAQISDNLARRIPAAETGLVASYALDSYQAGQVIIDRSGGGHHGTLHGTTVSVPAPSGLTN